MLTGDQDASLLHLEDETQVANAHCQQGEEVPDNKFHPGQNMMPHQSKVRIMLMEIVIAKSVVIELQSVPKVEGRTTHQRSQKPNGNNNNQGVPQGSVPMGYDRMDQVDVTVHADHRQEKNTSKHVQLGNEGIGFAQPDAEGPVEIHDHIGDVQRQEEKKNEICDSQVEEPESGDCLLPLESCEPNDSGISWNAQNKC